MSREYPNVIRYRLPTIIIYVKFTFYIYASFSDHYVGMSDHYVDMSDHYVYMSDHYVDMSDHYVDMSDHCLYDRYSRNRRGRMVVGFTSILAISAFHHWSYEFEPRSWRVHVVLDTTLCDNVCQSLATIRWFSSMNKTDRHDITEILLKVALKTMNQIKPSYMFYMCTQCLTVVLQKYANIQMDFTST